MKNTMDVQAALIERTGCSGIAFSASYAEEAHRVGEAAGSRMASPPLLGLPSFEEMVGSFSHQFPYGISYEDIEDRCAIIIHSSGTTGVPKPIPLTHGYLGVMDRQTQVPIPEGRQSAVPNQLGPDDLFLSTAPFFHIMGIFAQLMSVFHGTPFVQPPASASPLTVDTLVQTIETARPTAAVIVPSLIEQAGRSRTALETLSTLRMVCIGGAPLAPEIGAALNARTDLVSLMGMSELGLVLSLVPEHKEDWEYFEWNPAYEVRMDPVGGGESTDDSSNTLYELVIPRGRNRDIHGIFHTLPHLKTEFRTQDLFSAHPTRQTLWKYEGRADDTITLINGTKISPVPLEKTVEGHELVARAVVIGQGRSRTAVLVEPVPGCSKADELLRDSASAVDGDRSHSSVSAFARAIWPAVEQANGLVSEGAGIGLMRIAVAVPDKPFRTTPKGSTQRRKVLADYKQEIDRLYERDEYWHNMLRNG